MTVAVVGVGPGIGLAVARRFSAAGHHVALLARTPAKLADAVAALPEGGASAWTADASDHDGLADALGAVAAAHGPVEVLSFNAYASVTAPPSRLRPAELVSTLAVNAGGALAAVQAVLPAMQASGRGTVLVTGGGLALDPWPDYAALGAGKAALRNLCVSLAKELGPQGIHVAHVVVAGFVKPGTSLDPDRIAEEMYRLHTEPGPDWTTEVTLT